MTFQTIQVSSCLSIQGEFVEALASGGRGEPLAHTDDFCEELRTLADSYESMRSRAEGASGPGESA